MCLKVLLPFVGRFTDWLGRRNAFVVCTIFSACGASLSAIAPTLMWYFIGQLVLGVGTSIIAVQNTYIADVTLTPVVQQTKVISCSVFISNLNCQTKF